MRCSIGSRLQKELKFVKQLHATVEFHLEYFWCKVMLIEYVFFPKEAIEQTNQKEHIWRICSMNDIKATPE